MLRYQSLLMILLMHSVLCTVAHTEFFESLKDTMCSMHQSIKEAASSINAGLKTVGQTIRFVEHFIDSSIEEDCTFECKANHVPAPTPGHVSSPNGCGSLGVYLNEKDLPRPEMVECCNEHDLCYEVCGSDKDECDRKFKRCLYGTCDTAKSSVHVLKYKMCQGGSKLLFTATLALGCAAFKDAQKEACICVPLQSNQSKLREEL